MDNEFQEALACFNHMAGIRTRREAAWLDLSRWICPWRGIFQDIRTDRYERSDLARFTHCAASAVLRGASGMTSGMTPRNISWFKPAFSDPALLELPGAREWLDALDLRLKDCLANGGFYQAIQNFNLDLLWSGCALLYTETGQDNPLRYECVQIGTFHIACNQDGSLETVARSLEMTVAESARVFGKAALSRAAQTKLAREPYSPLRIRHLTRPSSDNYQSLWWEEGAETFLRKSHYNEMPYFFTVWNEGATPYGTGPGDQCLADARQLDMLERRKLGGLAKLVDPPMRCPASLKDQLDLEPGGLNYLAPGEDLSPLLDLGPFATALRYLQEEIAIVKQRLDQGLMADIFSSMPLDQRPPDMSATEFLERKRESLQQLGPVISAYEPNVLTPLLYRTAQTLDRAGLTPPPPDTLQGDLLMKIDFISPMANALRQTGAETTRALFSDIANMFAASQNAQLFDKVNLDQMVDELATGLGAPGSIIRSDQETAQIRQQRQQEQAAQLQAQQNQQTLQALAKLPQPTPEQLNELKNLSDEDFDRQFEQFAGG